MNRFAIKTVEAQANSDPTVVGESGNEIELGTVQGLSQGLIMAKIKIERVKTLEKRFAKKDGVSVGLAGPQDMFMQCLQIGFDVTRGIVCLGQRDFHATSVFVSFPLLS
jgi:hypothetical protein